MSKTEIHIIGGGLAGSEAAWAAANAGCQVVLHEMRPTQGTDAHLTDKLAELVCSNSFRSDDFENNAVGLLHEEMRRCGSLVMQAAARAKVPAGGALAVDREEFSELVSSAIYEHPLIQIERQEITCIPPSHWDNVIIATGPLTSPALSSAVLDLTGEENLAFFDAIAPIVHRASIDMSKAWFQSRYDKGDGADYINCPMNEDEYNGFITALLDAPKVEFKEWEKDTPYFEACLPVEVMAERGPQTLRFGPMKPVGLTNPHDPEVKSHAIVQLRQDNKLASLYNMVGFQTKLAYGAQTNVFRLIPGLQNAEFARLGGIHRNTFLNSPKLLDGSLRLHADPRLRFAGQVTGVEGYVESAACGMLAGRFAAAQAMGVTISMPPKTTAFGAMLSHITGGHITGKNTFQPMNINFGLFPPIEAPTHDEDGKRLKGKNKTRAKRKLITARALIDLENWLNLN